MITWLEFKTISYDSIGFAPNTFIPAGATYEMFTRNKLDYGKRVTEEHETAIIRSLLNDAKARELILKELGADDSAFVAYEVRQPITDTNNEIDIDLLVCPNHNPAEAIGIQVKRVKIKSENQEKDRRPNKLGEVKHGVDQVKYQVEKFGFHRNYLAIILQIEAINRDNENVVCAGPLPETMKLLYEFPQRESLPEDAGIIFIRLCQATVQSFHETGSVGICVDKEAGRRDQTDKFTNRIKELMRNQNAGAYWLMG